jgi:hypothetical protein
VGSDMRLNGDKRASIDTRISPTRVSAGSRAARLALLDARRAFSASCTHHLGLLRIRVHELVRLNHLRMTPEDIGGNPIPGFDNPTTGAGIGAYRAHTGSQCRPGRWSFHSAGVRLPPTIEHALASQDRGSISAVLRSRVLPPDCVRSSTGEWRWSQIRSSVETQNSARSTDSSRIRAPPRLSSCAANLASVRAPYGRRRSSAPPDAGTGCDRADPRSLRPSSPTRGSETSSSTSGGRCSRTLVAEHPQHLRAQFMLALYRAGRQAEALAAYRQARQTLVEERGSTDFQHWARRRV